MNDRNNLVLIGIGGAGTNTAKRISCCDRVIIESQNTPNQTADADRTILITSDIQDNGNRLFDSEISEINAAIKNYKIVVLCAGLGGNIGTNLTPIVAELAKKQDKMVITVVFKPYKFEGRVRCTNAEKAICDIQTFADCTVCIPNDNLLKMGQSGKTLAEALTIPDSIIEEIIDIVSRSTTSDSVQTSEEKDFVITDINEHKTTKCPVCLSTVNINESTCPVCGFEQLNFVAINKDEAELWMQTTVIPARDKWNSQKGIKKETINVITDVIASAISIHSIVECVYT